MGRSDYIPGSDTGFKAWVANFMGYANTHLVELGLTAPGLLDVNSAHMNFDTAMAANVTAQQAAQAARQDKSDKRDALESLIRTLVRQLQASDDVDDTERAALGITVPDTVKTMAAGGISTRPVGIVDTSQPAYDRI